MECKRLNRMIRDWYVQVQGETLAPARMVEFMLDHAATCDTCFVDPNIKEELDKITAIVLPPSKMTKKPKKKQPPMEPTAAALAAIESNAEVAKVADEVDDDADGDDEEIEVGDDDDDGVEVDADAETKTEADATVAVSDEPSLGDADLE